MYYFTCPNCGANLDTGEVCDCEKEKAPVVGATEAKNGFKSKNISNNKYNTIFGKTQ